MSAITGAYCRPSNGLDWNDLERMVASLAHRGSDGMGARSAGPVGLGHRMLWTTPESLNERLPLISSADDLILTADARLDNRTELISLLELSGQPPNEVTDSELILAAYQKWGECCPEKLLGDFAFAIWDGRKEVLFCARDHFGVKPFYYYASDRLFGFASEIKALFCMPEVPRRLNELRVAYHLANQLDDKEITFYQDILRLPPGHSLTVSREGLRLRPYWSLDPTRELQLGSDEEYAEAFREIFTEAVRCRVRSAFPVGSTLSGGLDSSSITCVARSLLARDGNRRLRTFSAVFDDLPECDERPFINTVLAQNGVEPHFVHADRLSPLGEWERVFWHADEVVDAPNLFMHWGLYRAAEEHGVRVFLDGIDGDSTVSHGTAYLTELAQRRQWIKLTREVKGVARNFNRSPWKPLRRYIWRDGLKPLAPEPLRRLGRAFGRRTTPGPPRLPTAINPNFAHRIALQERILALKEGRSSPARTEREAHYRVLTDGIRPFVFEVMDRAAAFSLEARYPFFDKRLVEFCLSLPPEQKLHQGWTRMILRRAMTGILPVEVQWRGGKSNLGGNFNRGLINADRGIIEETLANHSGAIGEYVDLIKLRETYADLIAGRTSDTRCTVWKAVTLALWLRYTGLSTRGRI